MYVVSLFFSHISSLIIVPNAPFSQSLSHIYLYYILYMYIVY